MRPSGGDHGQGDLRDCKHQGEPKPCFQVEAGFFYMGPFPLVVFDALLVHSKSASDILEELRYNYESGDSPFYRHLLVVPFEKLGSHRGVWQEDPGNHQ